MEVQPGEFTTVSGTYEEVDVLGKPTGNRVAIREGERLPRSPRGFGWRLIAGS